MNKEKAVEVMHLAQVVIERAAKYIVAVGEDSGAKEKWLVDRTYQHKVFSLTKTSGSLKRSSMDLTRALADMRKPG